jgi:hypothetical protein
MNDVGLDALTPQPAGEPETVTAGLEGDRDAGDRAACLSGLALPVAQKAQQPVLVRLQLLEGMAIKAWHHGGHEPAGLAHLDDCDDRAVLHECTPGPAQVIGLWHDGALLWLTPPTMMHCPRRVPIASSSN